MLTFSFEAINGVNESFRPWREVVLQDGQVVPGSKVHTEFMLGRSETCALAKQQQLKNNLINTIIITPF